MTLMSRLAAWLSKLPPAAETYHVLVEKGLKVPMPDGVTLLADHYFPRTGDKRPTILIRTPYGRANFSYVGRLFAERGFQVLIQSCRGTYGSGGQFHPFFQEHIDGIPTVEWIKQQAWFNGELALHGASYMGYIQWPIAAHAGSELKAMAAQLTAPDIRRAMFPGESFALDIFLNWVGVWGTGRRTLGTTLRALRNLGRACNHLPLRDADTLVAGQPLPFWRDWLEHNEPQDPWWKEQDGWENVSQITAPVTLLGGWYDFFLPDTIGLYQMLRRAGREPSLLIGPWAHSSWQVVQHDTREALAWFRAHLLGDRSGLRSSPVCIYVMGANEWRDYPCWPPAEYHPQRWYLQSDRGLARELPSASDPDRYWYDPADPTPAVGGISTTPSSFGPKNQRKLEARPDVLTYTSAPLGEDIEVVGPVQAELFVRSSLEHTDFFACLCDVTPSGTSINITSSLVRIWPEHPARESDGCLRVWIDLWPTACRFRRGHRLRLQVSSGAHPHFARNLGSGEQLATATRMRRAHQQVYHDPAHPSAIMLSVMS